MRRRPSIAILCAALAGALLAAGCGGGSDPDPKAELHKAFSPQGIGKLNSGMLDVEATIATSEGGDPAKEARFSIKGPFDEGSADLTATLSGVDPSTGRPLNFSGGITATPDNLYIDYGGSTYELGSRRFKQLGGLNRSAAQPPSGDFKGGCRMALQQLGGDTAVCEKIDPSAWLPKLSFDGDQDVGGASTEHFSGDIDVTRFLTDLFDVGLQALPAQARAQFPRDLLDQAASFVEEAGVDIYVGKDDDIPRRGKVGLKISVLGEQVDLGLDAQIEDANQPQTIAVPTGALPIAQLRDKLPVQLRGAFDCFLSAKTRAELNSCGTQLGGLGAGLPASGAAL